MMLLDIGLPIIVGLAVATLCFALFQLITEVNSNGNDTDRTHDIVDALIKDRKDKKDEEGVMLLAAFGKHLYSFKEKKK